IGSARFIERNARSREPALAALSVNGEKLESRRRICWRLGAAGAFLGAMQRYCKRSRPFQEPPRRQIARQSVLVWVAYWRLLVTAFFCCLRPAHVRRHAHLVPDR